MKFLLFAFALALNAAPVPLAVDSINPHYLRFRGKTGPLIASGGHYDAVLDPAFDYISYLDALHENGFNLTRIFNAVDSAMFDGSKPYVSRLSSDDYFARLKSFVAEAGKRNIAVEVTLFSAQYGNGLNGWGSWNVNPMNKGVVLWDRFNTLQNADLVAAQDAVVRKTVTTLNEFDNVYYEACNEPYFSGATAKQTREWSNHIAATITDAELKLPLKHLIAENLANATDAPNPAVSIFNFHEPLSWRPNKPVAFDETPNGCATPDRRQEAWAFLMAGGAVYNNHETGAPNCEGVRYELRNLAIYFGGLDLQRMKPNRDAVRQWPLYPGEAYMLEDAGRVYAVYLKGGRSTRISTLLLDLPAGRYQTSWVNPRTGDLDAAPLTEHPGGPMRLQTPQYDEDIALKLIRLGEPEKLSPAPQPKAPRPPARRAPRS